MQKSTKLNFSLCVRLIDIIMKQSTALLPSLILAAMTRMRTTMMRQLTRVIFLREFSVWLIQETRDSRSSPVSLLTRDVSDDWSENWEILFYFFQIILHWKSLFVQNVCQKLVKSFDINKWSLKVSNNSSSRYVWNNFLWKHGTCFLIW